MAALTDHESVTYGVEMLHNELAGHFAAIQRIRSDRRYSPEHRSELLEAALKEARGVVSKRIESERQDVAVTRKQGEKALADARHVEPDVLAARAAVLAPALSAAAQDPNALTRLFERRFENLTDRRLIAEAAEAMVDAGVGGPQFAEKWQRESARLELPEAEQEALEEIEAASEASGYLDAVEGLADLELRQAAGVPVGGMEHMHAARLAAIVHRYENSGTTQLPTAFAAQIV